MIDPRTVGVFIPTYDGHILAELAGQLVANSRFFGGISFTVGVSHVSLARNIMAEKFLRSSFDWMLCIDADIVPGLHDFPRMLSEQDTTGNAVDASITAVDCKTLSYRRGEKDFDGRGNTEMRPVEGTGVGDALVVAEYSYKDDSLRPVSFGLGFARIHRSVFEAIQKSTFADGQSRPWQFTHQGRLFTDFYPSGPILSQFVPHGEWKGEDHGFFMLCQLAGIVPRIEKRTELTHVGTKGYAYVGDQAGAN